MARQRVSASTSKKSALNLASEKVGITPARRRLRNSRARSLLGLDGKIPGDMAGIKVQGENKWLTIIQNASKKD